MKTLFFALLALIAVSLSSCGSTECPDGMHEETLNDGTTICVPDGI